jgi:CubicO group peptidase (beta-lactamase class C family)
MLGASGRRSRARVSLPVRCDRDLAGEVTLAQMLDWDFVTTRLAPNFPDWEPGTKHGYHAVTYGWLAGELVRRVDPAHRRISTFFAEEISDPLGAEFYAATIGRVDGIRLIDEPTRTVACTTVTPEGEPDFCLIFPTTFGMVS